MKIFLVYHPSGNFSVPNSLTWFHNLYEPLFDLNHDVDYFRLDEFTAQYHVKHRSPEYRAKLDKILPDLLLKKHCKNPIDFIFFYVNKLDILPETISRIKALGVPLLNFSCNNTHQFHLVEPIAGFFDLNLYSEKHAAVNFSTNNLPAYWFQMAANPRYYYPTKVDQDIECSFIGMNYARRLQYIQKLLYANINVNCFGPGWIVPNDIVSRKELKRYLFLLSSFMLKNPAKRTRYSSWVHQYDQTCAFYRKYTEHLFAPIPNSEYLSIINRSKINLGFLEVHSIDNDSSTSMQQHLHLREFEMPMCGALYFTNYSDELAEFFEPEKEVITFRNEHELLDKVKFFLNNPAEAAKIRVAARKRALADNTYQKRWTDLIDYLKSSVL